MLITSEPIAPAKQLNKQRNLQRAFDRAAASYYEHCYAANSDSLQVQTARLLLEQLNVQLEPGQRAGRLMDLGCGMGVHWPQLSARTKHYTGVDLSAQMIEQARQRFPAAPDTSQWLVGDAQALPFSSSSTDIVFSNLALQWCVDRSAVSNELYRVCRQGGSVHFSTLVTGSLTPLNKLQEAGLLQAINQYPTALEWQQLLLATGFSKVKWQQKTITTFHHNGADLLRSMKNIGAGQVMHSNSEPKGSQGLRTPAWLREVNSTLEEYRQPQGIPLHYQVALFAAYKGTHNFLQL